MSPTVTARVRHASGGPALTVSLIEKWDRADQPDSQVVGSSGPKDYIKNDVWELFHRNPAVRRVVMVRAGGPPFFLLLTDEGWMDVTGEPIVVDKEAGRVAA